MGIAIKVADATFTKYIGIAEIVEEDTEIPDTYPVTDTLKGLYYLGGTAGDSVVDHSGNGNNATVNGDGITYAEGYATFTGTGTTNRMDTPVVASAKNKTTIVAMFRVPAGGRPIASNIANPADSYGFVASNVRLRIYADGTAANHSYSAPINTENFVICAWTIDTNGVEVVRKSDDSTVEIMSKSLNVNEWAYSVIIGGYRANMSWNDLADIALVSIHEGDMTDEQLQQIFAYVRYYGESKGLTID